MDGCHAMSRRCELWRKAASRGEQQSAGAGGRGRAQAARAAQAAQAAQALCDSQNQRVPPHRVGDQIELLQLERLPERLE